MTTKEFLNWLADRLVNHYHEDPNTDFVLKLRYIANLKINFSDEIVNNKKEKQDERNS